MTRATNRNLNRPRVAQPCLSHLCVALALGLSACGGAAVTRAPSDARAAGGLPSYRPVPLREFGYGRSGSPYASDGARHAASSRAELEAFLIPVAPKAQPAPATLNARATIPGSARVRLSQRPASTAPVIALNDATAAPEAVDQPQQQVSRTEVSSADARSYAAREARSQSQQQYRGGDVLVITASTLVIVLLVVLLIVLLVR